ncbi:protein translocase subunit SecD [Candidatus Giovannonibacteria bacterium]|nr:protein translocase subunit SecD [Candidatus Giovannonibacteria bacterium]
MNSTKVRIIALSILILGLAAGFYDSAEFLGFHDERWAKNFRLGLDLQGGAHLEYEADVSSLPAADISSSMDGLKDVIERRVNLFGVSEPLVQTAQVGGKNRLIVELAGVFDINEAIKTIGETPYLEFKELARDSSGKVTATSSAEIKDFVPTELSGRFVNRAQLGFNGTSGSPDVLLEFNSEGAKLFEDITGRNVNLPLAVFLDGSIISAPIVQNKIAGGSAQITGNFTVDEAKQLVRRFNAGALPIPITLVSQQSVEPSLGFESLMKSLRAGIWGFLAVAIFMILWYRLPGLIAVVALGIYAALSLLLFKLIPVTLSSAGIAGFILSVGMAVDANILIFERMKEELKAGKSVDSAMKEGFSRAWTSIRDSNVSSLITAAILYWFGTSIVKGFALTLGLGVLVSMFSAITASRYLLLILPHRSQNKAMRFLFGSGLAH